MKFGIDLNGLGSRELEEEAVSKGRVWSLGLLSLCTRSSSSAVTLGLGLIRTVIVGESADAAEGEREAPAVDSGRLTR